MRYSTAGTVALALALPGTPALAHHSFAAFDMNKKVSITGRIRVFQWTNPHSYIQLMVKDAAGKETEYSFEMGAPMYLYARGWRPASLKPGMNITVNYSPLRNGSPGGIVADVTTADGKSIGKNS